ncbi:unnamed protein product [Microthlaspi erraticum]|uniref:SWIM-type domain-containing protein n=1 Tax=Microthlaspi erraticum TaxID=1685480 RepID=A0A6D2KGX6_9BRAS|nr:unnamed protein product [Microthlaspi erraticum]
MAETEVVLLCYWNCRIKHGPDGVYFEGSTPKEMRVKKKTDFSSFLDELYLITGFDKQKSNLEIVYRCPVAQSPNRFRYELCPVTCDGHLETMLELPSKHPSVNSVELLLELKPIGDPVENPRKRQKKTQQEEVKDEDQAGAVSGLWLEDDAMRVGLCFKDMEEMKKAVAWWSIKKQKTYMVRREIEKKDVYVFECASLGCKWSISAARMEEKDGVFEITKCSSGPHTCDHEYGRRYWPEFRGDFDVKGLEYEIERLVKVHPLLSTAELAKWWKEKYGYELIDTDQVDDVEEVLQRAKEKALKRVYGGWDESFSLMPKLMSALQSSNGVVVDWQYDDSLPDHPPGHASFRGVFWAFPQSIKGFEHCRPVIVVDSKDLGGKYKMKLMVACGVNAVNEYLPLAFAVTKEVTVDSWRWFLGKIREKVTQRKGLYLRTSPHPDIVAVVNEPESQWQEPWAYHRFCLDHLSSQFHGVFKDDKLRNLVDKAGSTIKKEEFDSYMKEMKEKNLEAWEWLDKYPPQQWALSHDVGRRRYGSLTINTIALFAVCERFPKVGMAGGVMLQFGPIMNDLSCEIVQLNDLTCTCGEFQRSNTPCVHALAVCDKLKINPLQYVDDCYSVERYHKTYAAKFNDVPEVSAWPEATGVPRLLLPVIEPPPAKASGKYIVLAL